MPGEIHEKCAVVGIVTPQNDIDAAAAAYESLFAMQHRGSEASGIVSESPEGPLNVHREQGMVVDVYNEESMLRLTGSIAIGHNRYSTAGAKNAHAQPVVDEAIGLALSMNGNLPSTTKLETFLSRHGIRNGMAIDTEMAGYALAQHIRSGLDLPDAIEKTYPLLTGAFSCVALHDGNVVAFRDPYGIRPLAIGELDGGGFAVTSETCGLDIIDSRYVREVNPGEMVIITKDGLESRQIVEGERKLDMFEFVYFARHDSRLYGQSVNEVRRRFGQQLAKEHPPLHDNAENIVVVPVPDTSIPAAEGYADSLGLTRSQAIIKNRYIGRTFMQPTNSDRHKHLRRKHNMIKEAVDGKDVVIIDDSIVRLNTMPRLVDLAYASGALSVSVLIASAPVRFPDYYGIDTPNQSELAAANLTIQEMKNRMGSDKKAQHLGYLSVQGMVSAIGLPETMFNLSCFTGEYPIDIGERKKDIYMPVSMSSVE
ncbi:MAG: amidophosphoribosyltransferase [Candidatus Saccharimonadales bacterium]